MSYDDLNEEITRLREELEAANVEKERLGDERESLVNKYEEEFEAKRSEIELASATALSDLKESQAFQIETLTTQLDQMQRAFSGDACGWELKTDRKTGSQVWTNSETNETSKDKPMIVEFAEKIQNIEKNDTDKNALAKAKTKATEAENKVRKMEVTVNEARAEVMNSKQMIKNWTATAAEIFHEGKFFEESMLKLHSRVMEKLPQQASKIAAAAKFKLQVEKAKERMSTKNEVIQSQFFEITKLRKDNARLQEQHDKMVKRVAELENTMQEKIEEVVAPLRLEVANSYALYMKEKAARTEDRVELADLWPPGWLMPSVLMKFRTLQASDKAAKREKALLMDAENALRADIRARVIEATKWTAQYDDYGQTFYQHADTGAAEWEQPAAMLYQPPPGRDSMGNKIKQAEKGGGADSGDPLAGWEQVADEWGQTYFTNTKTGETSWEAPVGFVVKSTNAVADPKDAATANARAVVTYLKEKEYAAKNKALANAQGGKTKGGDEDEEEDLVYDIQAVEELAAGNDKWKWQPPNAVKEDESEKERAAKEAKKKGDTPQTELLTLLELREMLYETATNESDLEATLRKVRHKLTKLSHRLIEKKKVVDAEELEARRLANLLEMQLAAEEAARQAAELAEPPPQVVVVKKLTDEEIIMMEAARVAELEAQRVKAAEARREEQRKALAAKKAKMKGGKAEAAAETKEAAPDVVVEAKGEEAGGASAASAAVLDEEEVWPQPKSSEKAPEEDIPPPNPNAEAKETPKDAAQETIAEKIERLKSEHEDALGTVDAPPPASEHYISLEVEQMLEDEAAPIGKLKNKSIQALAMQALWAGFSDGPVCVPPKTVMDGDPCTKWGAASFFATLDEEELNYNGPEAGASDDERDPSRSNQSNPVADEQMLPNGMKARAAKLLKVSQATKRREKFMRRSRSVAEKAAWLEIQASSDRLFPKKATAASVESTALQDGVVQSSITLQFKQGAKGLNIANVEKAKQSLDPNPGEKFPNFDADKSRVEIQAEERQARIDEILKSEQAAMEAPWQLSGSLNSAANSQSPDRGRRRSSVGSAAATSQLPSADFVSASGEDRQEYDYRQEEKKSASIAGESVDIADLNDGGENDGKDFLSPHRSMSESVSLSIDDSMYFDGDSIEELDAVKLLKEEAIIHDKALRPLLEEADKLRNAVWYDHVEMVKFWEIEIARVKDESKKLSKVIQEQQSVIASMNGELKGLGIATSKPKPPAKPGPIQLVQKPFISIGTEAADGAEAMLTTPELTQLNKDIKKNVYNGKAVAVPVGKKCTEAQKESLETAVENQNQYLIKANDEAMKKYAENVARFDASEASYANDEIERVAKYDEYRFKLRLLNLKSDALSYSRETCEKEIARMEIESGFEKLRGEQLVDSQGYCETVRAKQVMEHFRGPETIAFLQDQLILALQQRDKAMTLPEAATTILHRMQLEEERALELKKLRITIGRLREQLIEEGRRRKYLYEEEFASAQKEVRLIRDENSQHIERSNSLRVIDSLVKLEATTKRILLEAQVYEATGDTVGTDTAGLHGEVYSPDKNWTSPAVHSALAELVDVQRCLGAAIESRVLSRTRESVSRSAMNPGNATSIPPTPDQWLPAAERTRLEEEIEWIRYNHSQAVGSSAAVFENEKLVSFALRGSIEVLKNKLEASEASRNVDVTTVRHTADEAFEVLQQMLRDQTEAASKREARYEDTIRELSAKFSDTKDTLGAKVDVLEKDLATFKSMSVVLRYELSEYHVRENVCRVELERVKENWRKDTDALKVQLRSERNHTARLELWIAAMHDDVKYYLKEIKLRDQWLLEQKRQSEAAQLALKYEKWKQSTAIYSLCCDVDSLFLFFVQRIVNLAGSKKEYNDALRAQGAMNVLAAFCQSPRKELRRLAARALGSMGWNGYVEQRLIGWDIVRSWQLWTDYVIPLEEQKLREAGKTFEDKVAREVDDEGEVEGEFKPSPSMSLRAIIRERRQWALRKARKREGPNEENQILLGSEKNILRLLLDLCRVKEWDVVRYATMALCVAAYHENNNETMGRTKHCVETIVKLCRNPDEEIQAQAAAALANLGYASQKNQELIGACGGVDALVDLCRGSDVDVIEAGTAALANIVTLYSGNAVRVATAGGVDVLSHLITSNQIVNLLDFDQISEIQANAAECLANVTRNYGKANAARIHELGIAPLVLMCGSANLQVQRHSALVLGNVAQDEEQRDVIGIRGGVEALMLLCEKSDEAVQANALWALSNLAWEPRNQERIGRYFSDIIALCKSSFLPVQTNAVNCLANALYFHDKNRQRLVKVDGGVQMCVDMCTDEYSEPIQESALRAIVSLTYVDVIGVPLGKGGLIPILVARGKSTAGLIQKYAAMALLNLAVHDVLKVQILDDGGVEMLAGMQDSEDKDAREVALQVLQELADIRSIDHLADQKTAFGIAGMLKLMETDNNLIVKLACESLAEEVWADLKKQDSVVELGGAPILMGIVSKIDQLDDILNPALWSLRNLVHGHAANKVKFGKLSGVQVLVGICERNKGDGRQPILESALTALVNLVVDNETNSRNLLKHGLDVLIDVAESYAATPEDTGGGLESTATEATKSNAALATSLLQMVGPYNFLVCSNCGKEQLSGSTCESCGRPISFAQS